MFFFLFVCLFVVFFFKLFAHIAAKIEVCMCPLVGKSDTFDEIQFLELSNFVQFIACQS